MRNPFDPGYWDSDVTSEVPSPDPLARYFAGEALYGDDFGPEQLAAWCGSEREGYAGIVKKQTEAYRYKYHAINRLYGFRHLADRTSLRVLGIGSAYGEELRPLAPQAASIDIVEPSEEFSGDRVFEGVPVTYHKPHVNGCLGFGEDSFDVICAFGVLHHIANVSTVVRECARALAPGGLLLTREPIVSQGDWRQPRGNLTVNERGIPYRIFLEIVRDAGLRVRKASLLDFSPLARIVDSLGMDTFGNPVLTRIDRALALLFSFNRRYHRPRIIEKFGPASVYIVAEKPAHGL